MVSTRLAWRLAGSANEVWWSRHGSLALAGSTNEETWLAGSTDEAVRWSRHGSLALAGSTNEGRRSPVDQRGGARVDTCGRARDAPRGAAGF
ncbi:MAG TPA: hypothetical protein VGE38_01175 [Nocardioides sp.]|uniref:hypothetical protein n=1 Tax=Nocardioides sp. TaxID=35761 RepID=UPI002ED786A0